MPRQSVIVPTRLYSQESGTPASILEDQPTEPSSRDYFFTWEDGDIADADWQAMLDSMPLASNGNRKPSTNDFYVAAEQPSTYLNAQINNEVPTMSSGRLYAHVDSDSFDDQSQVRARVPQHFIENWYLKTGVLYRFDLEFQTVDTSGWSSSVEWAIIFEIWGQYSSAWRGGSHPVNPPFSLSFDAANYSGTLNLECQLYGTEDPDASAWEYSSLTSTVLPIGSHTATVWWKKDHRGHDSFCRVDINGTEMVTVQNVKLGTPFDANGNVPLSNTDVVAGIPQLGVYTPRTFSAPGVECYFDKFDISRPLTLPS